MSRATEIARFYGQGKERKTPDGWLTRCPVHGDENPSLAVKDSGDNDVDVHCFAGCDWKGIKDRFRADGLLPQWTPERHTRQQAPQQQSHAPNKAAEQSTTPEGEEKLSYPWKKSTRDEQGLAKIKEYFAPRNIVLDDVPLCLKWGDYVNKQTGDRVEQVVAAVTKPSDKAVYACNRTVVDTTTWVRTGKFMLGKCGGRAVHFDRKGPKFLYVVGEGIETVLSALQATGHNGAAGLTANGLEAMELPEETNHLFILVDSDTSFTGQKAAINLAQRFEASDPTRSAMLVSPDETCFSDSPVKLDFNDLLMDDPSGESIRQRFEVALSVRELTWEPPVKQEDGADEQSMELTPLAEGAEGILDPLACFDHEPPPKTWHVLGTVPAGSAVIFNGPGGTSKSTTLQVMTCAITSGRSIPPFDVDPAGKRVLFLNVEDGADDLQRVLYHINKHYQFSLEEKRRIASNLFVFPGRGLVGAMLCKNIDGLPVPTVHGEWLMRSLENINPAVVVIDTKSRTYGLDENSNSDNAAYISFFETYLPKHPETSFLIVHHNSKERAGDGGQSSARGGSALIDNARGNLVFTHMTEAEAQKHGVNHLDYFIMTNAKNNYARRADRSIFTRVEGGTPVLVDLENESRSAALDRLIGLLTEDFPGGIQKRELLERDGGKVIRDILAEEYSMRKPDFKRLVEFGIESTRLTECEDFGSGSHNKPVLVRVRTVTDQKSAPRQLDFGDSVNC